MRYESNEVIMIYVLKIMNNNYNYGETDKNTINRFIL